MKTFSKVVGLNFKAIKEPMAQEIECFVQFCVRGKFRALVV